VVTRADLEKAEVQRLLHPDLKRWVKQ
jgi:hypothetical protein